MPNPTLCPVCEYEVRTANTGVELSEYDCHNCGTFKVVGTALAMLNGMNSRDGSRGQLFGASLGHWLQDQQRFDRIPVIGTGTVANHRDNPFFPSISTRLANLLRVIGDAVDEPGKIYEFDPSNTQLKVGCKTSLGLIGLGKHLIDQNYIDPTVSRVSNTGTIRASLTVAGWVEYEKVLSDSKVGRKAFIAMPFGKADLDEQWLPGLRDAVGQTGYLLERVDDNPEPGLIDTRMKLQIKAARFLLVELTHSNLGAYWEAGMAEGLGKPVIYLRRNDDATEAHFDVEHAFRVQWDADNMEAAFETIKATIRNAMPDAVMTDDA